MAKGEHMDSLKFPKTRNRQGERGSILAASALGMLSFILAVGLGVDISHLYLAKNELQNAADAAALAGASGLDFRPSGIAKATFLAKEKMNSYQFQNTKVEFKDLNVRFAKNLSDFDSGTGMDQVSASSPTNAPDIKFVKVITPQSPVNMAFVSMVLGNSLNLTAEAVGGLSVPLNLFTGYLPAFVVDNDDVSLIKPGQLYTFRGDPQGSVAPGNYQLLNIDGSGGASDRIGLASGVKNIVGPGGYVETKPGITAGAVRQGINTRFDDYGGGLDPIFYPPDSNIKEDIFHKDYGTDIESPTSHPPGFGGRRVVLIPIVKVSQVGNGQTTVQIDHFGAFFLQSKVSGGNGDAIQAEYIDIGVVVGGGEYDPTLPPNPGPPIVKPVLYR